jgi:hypothetical protein
MYNGITPTHPELTTVEELSVLPNGSIVSVTGHEFPLFEYSSAWGAFMTLCDNTSNTTPAELLEEYAPIRLVWVP